jgi:hypothetical protein
VIVFAVLKNGIIKAPSIVVKENPDKQCNYLMELLLPDSEILMFG